ncbi:MAG: hypothetical protein N2749_03785 [Clostridia bacterium]|nr:hypothetical protein [Clostridia bacterium]
MKKFVSPQAKKVISKLLETEDIEGTINNKNVVIIEIKRTNLQDYTINWYNSLISGIPQAFLNHERTYKVNIKTYHSHKLIKPDELKYSEAYVSGNELIQKCITENYELLSADAAIISLILSNKVKFDFIFINNC